jgi:hypothetical protein
MNSNIKRRLALIAAVLLVTGVAGLVVWGRRPLGLTDAALQALQSDGAVAVTMGGSGGGQWISSDRRRTYHRRAWLSISADEWIHTVTLS